MRRSAASAAELLPWATGGLVTAVVAEFLLLRVVNRMADRVPGLRGDAGLGVLFAGTAAMNLALLLGMGFLAAVAVILWERSRVLAALALAAAILLGVTACAPAIAPTPTPTLAVLDVLAEGASSAAGLLVLGLAVGVALSAWLVNRRRKHI